jgi:hypothetical protein
VKPLRLGAGSRIDSHGVEKDSLPKIIFEDQNDTTQPSQSIELVDGALHVFNDPEGPNRTDLGSIPGSGGGGGGQVDEVQAGPGVSVDNSDPERPIVSAPAAVGGCIEATFEATPGFIVPPSSLEATAITDYTIRGWRILTRGAIGSAQFDVQRRTSLGGSSTSIVGSNPPAMIASAGAESTDLTGWTVSGDKDDIITVTINVSGGLQWVRLELLVDKH